MEKILNFSFRFLKFKFSTKRREEGGGEEVGVTSYSEWQNEALKLDAAGSSFTISEFQTGNQSMQASLFNSLFYSLK